MVFTTNNNLSAPQFMDFTVNTKFLPILVFTDFTINDNLLPLKFLEFTNNTNKFSQELVVPTLCLLPVISVSVMPRLNLRLKQRLKLNTTGLNTMVNTTVPLPAPTLSPVILMLQLTPLDTPPPTTPLILHIPQSTRLPSTTKLKFKPKGWLRTSNKSLGKQPQLKNRFFPHKNFSYQKKIPDRMFILAK